MVVDSPASEPGADGAGGDAPRAVVVTPMRRRHVRSVLRIENQQAHAGWSAGLFLAELGRNEGRTYLVAKQGGRVVGFVGVLHVDDDGHVTTLVVDEGHRRQAVASRLLVVAARRARALGARNLTLEVRASNEPALALYRRFGFAPVGARRGYYADTAEDAIVMWANDIDTDAYEARLAAVEAGWTDPTLVEGHDR